MDTRLRTGTFLNLLFRPEITSELALLGPDARHWASLAEYIPVNVINNECHESPCQVFASS